MPIDLDRLDERQVRIHQRLADFLSPGTATLFRDSCRLLNLAAAEHPPVALGTHTHLVAHLLREVESALGRVLSSLPPPATPPALTDWAAEMERTVRDALKRAGVPDAVFERAVWEIQEAVTQWAGDIEPKTKHERRVRNALHALRISEAEPAGALWIRLANPYAPYGLAGRAHRRALADPRPLDAEFLQFWDDVQGMLDRVLERVSVTFLPFLERARQLALDPNPGKASLTALSNELPPDEIVFQEFFAHATPGWVHLLAQGEYFRRPLDAEPIDEDGIVRFPDWPQAGYLARIAPDQPRVVADIIAGILTDNPVIHAQLLSAAIALPAEHAVRIAPAVKHWVEQPYKLFESLQYGRLVAHLAEGGFVAEATDLARSVMAVVDPEPSGDTPERREISRWIRGPQPRIGQWDYAELLRDHLPALAERAPLDVLRLLRNLLADAVAIKESYHPFRGMLGVEDEGEEEPAPDGRRNDGSSIWFRNIEGRAQPDDIEELLVVTLRRHAVRLAAADPTIIAELVNILEAGSWAIFHRIALHILAQHPGAALDLARERVMDAGRFDDTAIRREYDALAAATFPHLSPEDRERYLGWVEEGLPGVAWRSRGGGPEPAELKPHEADDRWRHDRLAPVADHLDPPWRARFDALRTELARVDAVVHAPRPAPTPAEISLEEALAMPAGKMLSAAAAGRTADGRTVPADLLQRAVERTPEPYADAAERVAGLPTVYREALLRGLLAPVERGPTFGWGPVLSLMDGIVAEAEDGGRTREAERLLDRVGDLLENGFLERSAVPIPPDLRDGVWPMLEGLLRLCTRDFRGEPGTDEAPPRAQGRLGKRTVALLIRYGFWRRVLREETSDERSLAPEVAHALETILDLPYEAAPWVRTTFAREFPFLVSLDPGWADARRERVFPPGQEDREEFDLAWDAYLRNRAYGAVASVLAAEYERAVDDLAGGEEDADPARGQRLASHLMRLFNYGFLDLEEDGRLARFFRRAPPVLRANALELLARRFYRRPEVVTDERRDRLQAIWDYRLAAAETDAAEASELVWFGWWFASGKFPDDWSLDRLRRTLARTGGRILRVGDVVKRLVALAPERQVETFECLRMIALGTTGPAEVHSWWEAATPVLEAAFATGEPIRTVIVELVNQLSAPPHRFAAGGGWLARLSR